MSLRLFRILFFFFLSLAPQSTEVLNSSFKEKALTRVQIMLRVARATFNGRSRTKIFKLMEVYCLFHPPKKRVRRLE